MKLKWILLQILARSNQNFLKSRIKYKDEVENKLINREIKKFEYSIIVAGGISYYGLSDLILLKEAMQEFSYFKELELEYFKDDFEAFYKENKICSLNRI